MNDEPGYILPPAPPVKIRGDVDLVTDDIPADADPRVTRLQTLENWSRVYKAAADELLRELWAEGHREGTLDPALGMSRMGLRKRAEEPAYRRGINERRRTKRAGPKEDPPREH